MAYEKWAAQVGDSNYTLDNWLPFFEKSLHYIAADLSKRAANATPDVDISSLGTRSGPLSLTFANYAQAHSLRFQKGFQEIGIRPINGFTSGNLLGPRTY